MKRVKSTSEIISALHKNEEFEILSRIKKVIPEFLEIDMKNYVDFLKEKGINVSEETNYVLNEIDFFINKTNKNTKEKILKKYWEKFLEKLKKQEAYEALEIALYFKENRCLNSKLTEKAKKISETDINLYKLLIQNIGEGFLEKVPEIKTNKKGETIKIFSLEI